MMRPITGSLLSFSALFLGASAAWATGEVALTCVGNSLGGSLNFQYRWGSDAEWQAASVGPGQWRPLVWEFSRGEKDAPQLELRFDRDTSDETDLVGFNLESKRATGRDCRDSQRYSFHLDDDRIALAADSTPWTAKPTSSPSTRTTPPGTGKRTPGGLEATMPVGCVDPGELTSDHTPADLFPGIWACVEHRKYTVGARLLAVAYAYGQYDMGRVADPSAHEAIQMMLFQVMAAASDDQRQGLLAGLEAITEAELLPILQRLGRPTYYPHYMIQSGSAVGQPGPEIVADFDAEAAWAAILADLAPSSP